MNWAVIWLDGALDQFATMTASAWGTPGSEAITRAMARVEAVLETGADQAGESRTGHQRVLVELPLTVEFEVHPEQRTAVVTRVRYTPGR